jgi:hypothetical protein
MKPSKQSPSPRRLGSSITFALTFALASLSLAGACDVEDAPLPDDVEFIDDEELRAVVLAPTSPQELEAHGFSEEDVASFESRIEDFVSEEDDEGELVCAATCFNNCKICCVTIQSCNVVCGAPYCP